MNQHRVTLRIVESEVARECELIGIAHGHVHLQMQCDIPPETRVLVKIHQVTLEGTVEYSHPKNNGHLICLSVEGESELRRREPRLPVRQPAVLLPLDGGMLISGVLTDLSRSGLRIRSQREIPCGAMVIVETNKTMMVGETRHCTAVSGSYETGIEITDILTDRRRDEKKTGMIESIRWKLATWIVGDAPELARSVLR